MEQYDELYFRDQFRSARSRAFRDAEAFQDLVYCLERVGIALARRIKVLADYKKDITTLANRSPLAKTIPTRHQYWHIPFSELYEHVRVARNDAFHQGAVARHLTEHALKLILILEDAIMTEKSMIRDFMVRHPVVAFPWQPISFVREQMLTNGFSFIPIYLSRESDEGWKLISEYAIAKYLRRDNSIKREVLLAVTVEQALESKELKIEKPDVRSPTEFVHDVVPKMLNMPVLVIDKGHPTELLGIVTAFDVM